MLLFSAPGTGTNFVMRFMTEFGWRNGGLAMSRMQRHDFVVQMHSHPGQFSRFEAEVCPLQEAFPEVIVPLRHPYKAYRSFGRTGLDHEVIVEHWRCLVDKVEDFEEVFFVPIDVKKSQRLPLLQGLADFVGIDDQEWVEAYAAAWKPVNEWPEGEPKPPVVPIPDLDFAVDWFDGVRM